MSIELTDSEYRLLMIALFEQECNARGMHNPHIADKARELRDRLACERHNQQALEK